MLVLTVDPEAVRGERVTVLSEAELQHYALVGVELRPLVVRIEDKVAQGVEDGLFTDQLVVHRNMRMVGDDEVGAHLKVFQIAVPGIGRGDRGKFFSAVRDNDAPAALLFDPGNDLLNGVHIAPAEAPGLVGAGGFTAALVADAEQSDPARLVENDGAFRLFQVHSHADRLRPELAGLLKCYLKSFGPGVHDVVIGKGGLSRMLSLSMRIDDTMINDYKADGVIVSTATGSTAYSLSAGGPIVNPSVPALLITPICPHTLDARPMIIPDDEEVQIYIAAVHQDIQMTFDGQESFQLLPGDVVYIRKGKNPARIIKFGDKNYYDTLKSKLWGNSK